MKRVELTGWAPENVKPTPTQFKRHDAEGNPMVRILTYNIWFENITEERISCILEIIKKADADFVCLQEVTDETRTAIMLSDVVKTQYLKAGGSATGNQFIVPYGCIMISKYKCHYFERYFMSRMGRSLLLAEAPLPINLIVSTSHFESLGFSAEVRKDQMTTTFDLLKRAQGDRFKSHSVVVGDFNFHSTYKKEEAVLTDNGFRDAMHDFVSRDEPTMLKSKKFRAWRPDKVVT